MTRVLAYKDTDELTPEEIAEIQDAIGGGGVSAPHPLATINFLDDSQVQYMALRFNFADKTDLENWVKTDAAGNGFFSYGTGVALFSSSFGVGDFTQVQQSGGEETPTTARAPFSFSSTGKKLGYATLWGKGTLDTATLVFGLIEVNASIIDGPAQDGAFFRYDPGTNNVEFVSVVSGTETTATILTGVTGAVSHSIGYQYDGNGTFTIYWSDDGETTWSNSTTLTATATTDNLAASFAAKSDAGGAFQNSFAYLNVASER